MKLFDKLTVPVLSSLSGHIRELKNKGKIQLGNPKVVRAAYGRGRLQELFITKFKSQFKQGFTKVVISRTGCLQERSLGELLL